MADSPGRWSCALGVLAIALMSLGLFVLDDWNNRVFAVLFGMHFANRSEIAALKHAREKQS